jgi:septal ring factor EnvC (AmiA/AmiB activator)
MIWSYLKALDLRVVLTLIIIVLLSVLGWSVYSNLESAAERKGLEEALEILDERVEEEKVNQRIQIDSLKERIELKEASFLKLEKDYKVLENRINKVKKNIISNEKKANITRITNADSLSGLLSNRYY